MVSGLTSWGLKKTLHIDDGYQFITSLRLLCRRAQQIFSPRAPFPVNANASCVTAPQLPQNVLQSLPREQILNRQTFKALPAIELINLTSLVGRFYTGSALNVRRFHNDWHPGSVLHARWNSQEGGLSWDHEP